MGAGAPGITYIDVGIKHVLKVFRGDGWHFVDQVHQKAAHTVVCCHFTRLREQNYISRQPCVP